MRTRIWQGAVTLAALWWSLPSQAALVGRSLDGNMSTVEAYYDTVLNITWLADANYAQTSGHDADGYMNWSDATGWASNLSFSGSWGTASDWRLPTVTDTGTSGCDWAYSGTDCGYNVNTGTGEMAHMFYTTLGNLAYYNTSGSGPQSGWGLTNTGPFTNLQPNFYWSGTVYAPYSSHAWYFYFYNGYQNYTNKNDELRAWAVHSGDVGAVAPVPIPAAVWLLGSGLVGLLGLARPRRLALG